MAVCVCSLQQTEKVTMQTTSRNNCSLSIHFNKS